MVGDTDFIYVLTEKVYILHLISDQKKSYSHAPLFAIAEGVFLRKETALRYAGMYAAPNDTVNSLFDKQTRI